MKFKERNLVLNPICNSEERSLQSKKLTNLIANNFEKKRYDEIDILFGIMIFVFVFVFSILFIFFILSV